MTYVLDVGIKTRSGFLATAVYVKVDVPFSFIGLLHLRLTGPPHNTIPEIILEFSI